MTEVVSSQIHSIGYEPTTKTMYVQFRDRKTQQPKGLYSYANVPEDLYQQFMNAPSIGSFHGSVFKYNSEFPYTKLA